MKKNLPIYILLLVLIIMNGFFLFNFLNRPDNPGPERRQGPGDFVAKELQFNTEQMNQYHEFTKNHDHEMRRISEDIRQLKGALFSGISSENRKFVDSITSAIGKLEAQRDANVFYHFKEVQSICNQEQKQRFSKIIKDALHKRGRKRP